MPKLIGIRERRHVPISEALKDDETLVIPLDDEQARDVQEAEVETLLSEMARIRAERNDD